MRYVVTCVIVVPSAAPDAKPKDGIVDGNREIVVDAVSGLEAMRRVDNRREPDGTFLRALRWRPL